MAVPRLNWRDYVADPELLYRRVMAGRGYYEIDLARGTIVSVSSQAFGDPHYRPSVDRAELCHGKPEHTQINESDAVLALVTGDIRASDPVPENDKKGNFLTEHKLDVEPDPVETDEITNLAHAVVLARPEFSKLKPRREFRRLQERLARLAMERGKWPIKPVELR